MSLSSRVTVRRTSSAGPSFWTSPVAASGWGCLEIDQGKAEHTGRQRLMDVVLARN